jgi:flagellar biosynthesis protein FlhA
MKHEEKTTPEAMASLVDSCISFCDVIVEGKDCAVALKYDEENMFTPMIVFVEKDAAAEALVRAAENLGVFVVKNVALAKNLSSYGKAGGTIPELSYRDVSLVLARSGAAKPGRRAREFRKIRKASAEPSRPISLELGASLFSLTGEEPGREKLLAEPLNAIRKKLIRLFGIPIPVFRVFRSRKLKSGEYRILFKGLEAGRGRLELGWYAGERSANGEIAKGEIASEWPEAAAAIPDLMNNPENLQGAAKAAASALVRHTDEIIQRRGPELLGRDEVEAILDAAEERYPVVTGEGKSLLSLGIIREILQSLVSDQVSIRYIAVILETLADWGNFGPAPSDLIIEQIRQSLKRQICLEYTDDRLTLRVLTLEQKLEKRIADFTADSSVGEDWAEIVFPHVKRMEEKGFPPVILCSPKARSPLKEATRKKLPELAVLSYIEIPSDISVEPLGEIHLEENTKFSSLGSEK